jgi:phospholipid/cholesterol/gamma-HCH transport system substrate-binding protein
LKTKRSNDWMVGLAIIAALVLVVVSTLWLQQADLSGRRLGLTSRFRDVGNMQVGNAVVIRGVRSGRVKGIELGENGWVIVELELEEGIELPRDPVVLVQSASLFGEWQATVTSRSGAPDNREVHAQLDDVDYAPKGALPGAVLPDVAQLTTVAGGIAGDVASVAERVRTAFDDEAARELRTSLRNFNQMSNDLARTVRSQSRNLDSIALDVRAGAGDLSEAAAALARTIGRVDVATDSGEIRGIVEETQRASQNIREASARLNALMTSLEGAEVSLRGVVVKADSVFGKVERGEGSLGMLINDPSLYRNSDSLMIDLRALIADVKRDPKRYFGLRIF